jgi:fibronectin type 3 domain-containing protein
VTVTVTAAPVIAHSANLTWNASTDAAGYNVLRGAATGGPYTLLGNTSLLAYIDTAVQSGVSFYYVVRAVDSTGTESANSLEVKAVIP